MDGDLTGVILDGRYRVLEPVSEGAMGVVYRAERVKLGRIVAIKILHDELPAELSSRQRFEIEATAMAKLEHPNCASVLDVGVHEDKPFVVMDFVSGDNLRDVIARGPLPLPRAVEIVRQVLSGLAHAHEHNIIHRDIKPANIVLSQKAGLGDHVKILDFGLARIIDTPKLTTGIVVGTPSYMAPEQIRGTQIDHRADLYACGVLLFELLTGHKPFVSPKDDPVEVCSMHLKNPPPALRDLQPGIEFGDLEAIVARALAKKPEERFATAVEFAGALDMIPRQASVSPSAPVAMPVAGSAATETGWAVPDDAKSSMFPSEPAMSGAAAYATPAAGSPVAPPPSDAPAMPPVAAPVPSSVVPSTAATAPPIPKPPLAGIANVRPGKAPPAPFARPTAPSTPRGVPAIANPPPSGPIPQVATGPTTVPTAVPPHASGPATAPAPSPAPAPAPVPAPAPAPPPFDAAAEIARLEAASAQQPAASSAEPAPAGLPASFDLSMVIPRGTPTGANEKGLAPAFDLSIAIPSPATPEVAPEPGAGFDLAIPQQGELPILERSGAASTSGPAPIPSVDQTKLGMVALDPGRAPASGEVPLAAPDASTQLASAPPLAEPAAEPAADPPPVDDGKATVAFLGAPPAGPSPLDAPDAPATDDPSPVPSLDPVALPPPPPLAPLIPRKQWQVVGAVLGVVVLIAIVVGTCKGKKSTTTPRETPAESEKPAPSQPTESDPADEQVTRIQELIDAGSSREAISQASAARKVFPEDARFAYLLGKLYFERQSWTPGLKQFRDTLALDPTYRSDPDLIKAVLKAFITPADYPAELGAFLRKDIGPPARQYLEETAASHPRANVRARARSELAKM